MARKLKDTQKSIARLTEHLEYSGWHVKINRSSNVESSCDPNNRSIIINESRPHLILWTMLHEAGHATIFKLDDYALSFGEIHKQHKYPVSRQTLRYHYQKLKEEMLAWETGLNLAKSLNIYVDEVKYEKWASKAYMTYVYNASQLFYQKKATELFAQEGLDLVF